MSSWPEPDSISVLHVDDDPALGDLVSTYLERLNDDITVATETDSEHALERVRAETVDCVVTDHQMPGMDGVELFRSIREEFPNLPVVLFTGRGSEEVASEAIEAGVSGYLQKDGTDTYELLANQVETLVSRERSEHRAAVAQERLVQLYEQTDGFYVLDGDWRVTYWNRRIADRTGIGPDDVIGEVFWEQFPEAVDTEIHDRFHEAMESGEGVEFDCYYDPQERWIEVRVYPVDEGLFVHSRDISEETERKRELENRNRILESFANTVSHDLRNPLNVADGRLELAKETGDFDHLEEVAQAHNRMRNLIDELLRVARNEEMTFSTVSLDAVARSAWETVATDGMELVVESDSELRANETQLRRLFENLFWNALEHGDASTVRVGTLDGDDDGFYVADDGEGIRDVDRKQVFESGYSTDDSSPGYGLAIVAGIAEKHDWCVEIADTETRGTRFEIRRAKL